MPPSASNAVGVTSPNNPITPPTATGNAPLWESSTAGAAARPVVFFYGAEFAPYAAAERWPRRRGVVAVRHVRPARAHAVQFLGGVLRHPDLHLLARPVFERAGSTCRPTSATARSTRRAPGTRPCRHRRPGRRRPSRSTTPPPRRFPCSTSPTTMCWSDRASRPPSSTVFHRHRSPTTWPTRRTLSRRPSSPRPTRSPRPSAA